MEQQVVVGGSTVLAFEAEPAARRVRSSLVLEGLERRVDVSAHPAAAVAALHDRAQRHGLAPAEASAVARARLAEAVASAGAWAAPADAGLLVALGGASQPLLGAAYDTGAEPVDEVPPWARPVVQAATVRAGARAAFGDAATRPVVKALVRCLGGGDHGPGPAFSVLALALAGARVLSPDALARVLGTRRVAPAGPLPDGSTIRSVATVAWDWGPRRTERVLRDAAARPDGLDLLVRTARFQRDLGIAAPARLPNRLEDLATAIRCQVATAPAEPPRRRAPAVDPHRVLAPPAAATRVEAGTRLPLPSAVAALAGTATAPFEWVVPRTVGDLQRWGRVLSNCIGDFGPAAAAGTSTIVGLRHDGRLAYALELTPAGVLRQFTGRANRRVEGWVVERAVTRLVAVGALDPHHPENRPWMQVAASVSAPAPTRAPAPAPTPAATPTPAPARGFV